MATVFDLRVTELLCSRLCHDLVSPVGAVANGLELVAELGQMDDDIAKMIDDSARLAAARLRFFRSAYGLAGGRESLPTAELVELAQVRARHEGYALDWAVLPEDIDVGGRAGKLALNLLLVAEQCLLRDGSVTMRSNAGIEAVAHGEGATMDGEVLAAMAANAPAEMLTVRTVHGYFTGQLAKDCGMFLDTTAAPGEVSIRALRE